MSLSKCGVKDGNSRASSTSRRGGEHGGLPALED
jgi:hypothetical protein